jgi:hypothetical protein
MAKVESINSPHHGPCRPCSYHIDRHLFAIPLDKSDERTSTQLIFFNILNALTSCNSYVYSMYIRYSFDCQWGISLKAEKPKKNVSNIVAISTTQQRAPSTFKKNPRWGYIITSKLQIPDHQSLQSTCKKPVVSDPMWYPLCAHRSPKFTSPNSSNGCCCRDGSGSLVGRTVETALKMSNHWVHGDFSMGYLKMLCI